METISTFADWIRRQRKMLHLTQAALAARVGCAVVTIKKIEQEMRLPSREMAELLAKHLAIPASQRETFLSFARGQYVENLPAPLDTLAQQAPENAREIAREITRENSRDNTSRGSLFVAREREVEQLETHLIATLNGSGRIVFITGEAGRGKTTLMTEFARRVVEQHPDSVAALGNCDAYAGVGDPYLPFREIMSLLSGEVESRWDAGILSLELAERLWAMLPHFASTLIERGPALFDVLIPSRSFVQRATNHSGLNANDSKRLQSFVDRHQDGPGNTGLGTILQQQIFEQATQLLRALAMRHPLLLLLDDLQWIDNTSAGLLFHLGRRLAGSRILILGAYRPSEVPLALAYEGQEAEHPLMPVVQELKRRHGDIEINLDRVSIERGRAFVSSLLDQEPNRLGNHFRESLFRRTQGDPLFTVELLHEMKARGTLIRNESGEWIEGDPSHHPDNGNDLSPEALPTRIEAVITRRLGRLPAPLREMLKVASVEGETFTAEVIARVLEVGERRVVGQLSTVADRVHHLVRAEGSTRLESQNLSHYRFGHILFQKYLYESLDEAERLYLHEAVGHALSTLYATALELHSGQIAVHYERAGQFEQAIRFYEQAGQKAQLAYAPREAIAHFSRALALLKRLPASPQRGQQELALQIALGSAYVAIGGYGTPQAIVAYTRVKMLCAELNVPLSPPTLRALALISLSAPNVAEASIWAEQLLQLSQREGDPFLLAEAHYMMGVVCFWRAEFTQARSHLEQALAHYDPSQLNQHIRLYGQDLRVICLARLALTLWYLGSPEQALQMIGEARRDAQAIAHPVTLAYALCFASWVYNDCGDLAASQEAAQQLLTLARELSLVWWQAAGAIFCGWIEVQRGNAQAGQVEINHGIEVYHTTGQNTYRPYMLSLLAQSYQHLDDPHHALRTVEEALEFSAQTGHCFWDAELYRLQGEFSSQLGLDASQVEALYVKALELARHQHAQSLELRAAMRLCQLWQQQGQAEKARLLLAQVYNQFTEGFDLPEVRAAVALLDELNR